ncbi:MAG: glycosyltransferase family 4 protein [Candidatus Harrisonbacteria bacterium]|nr:glycosyltransferase family 4 protein [Candidatus Harrisonbacteria bacterium]
MKICIITQSVDANDAILGFFNRWISEFAKHAGKVEVIANRVGAYAFPPNVAVRSLGRERGAGRIARYIRFFRYTLYAIRRSDATFVHMIPAWVVLLYPFALIFRKPLYLWYTHKSVTLSLRLATFMAAKVFTASEESFRIATPKKVVVGHAIDTELFTPGAPHHNPRELRLLTVGRITSAKDTLFLIDVLDALRAMAPQSVHLPVVGAPRTERDRAYAAEVYRRVADYGLTGSVDFVGEKTYTELPTLYRSHDVFLHASETGSVDKVVIEAMACAMPVVTTSEAFRGMLPEAYRAPKDVKKFAEKVAALRGGTRDTQLRNIVLEQHNLTTTIARIAQIISDGVKK